MLAIQHDPLVQTHEPFFRCFFHAVGSEDLPLSPSNGPAVVRG